MNTHTHQMQCGDGRLTTTTNPSITIHHEAEIILCEDKPGIVTVFTLASTTHAQNNIKQPQQPAGRSGRSQLPRKLVWLTSEPSSKFETAFFSKTAMKLNKSSTQQQKHCPTVNFIIKMLQGIASSLSDTRSFTKLKKVIAREQRINA